jgi:hypothetical protein
MFMQQLLQDLSKGHTTEDRSVLGILLGYTSDVANRGAKLVVLQASPKFKSEKPVLGVYWSGQLCVAGINSGF